MMHRVIASLVAVLAMGAAALAQTPNTVRLCAGTQPNCPLIGPGNKLPVDATFSGSVAVGATAQSTLPVLSPGSEALYQSLSGGLNVQPVWGTNIVSMAAGLPVQPGTATTWAVTQSASPWVVSNGGTFAVQAAQSGTWTVQPGNTANTTPWLFSINQGGNTATVSAGGALKVDGSAATQPVSGTVAVTQSTSPWIVAGGGTAGSAATGVATVQGIASMTPLLVNPGTAANWGVGATGAAVPANTHYIGINSGGNLTGWTGAVTNAGVFATQSAITAASGSISSGAVSSGAIASGAVASGAVSSGAFGAVSSGAYASGSLASGAVVDLTNLSTPITPATATATKGVLLGGQYNSTQATFTNGQQGAVQLSSRGEAKTNIMDAAGNARGANVNASNQLSVSLDGGSGGTVAATQSGTWTVQPGNTANTTAWLVTPTPSSASGAAVTSASSTAAASAWCSRAVRAISIISPSRSGQRAGICFCSTRHRCRRTARLLRSIACP
jgi:hypothetical protein